MKHSQSEIHIQRKNIYFILKYLNQYVHLFQNTEQFCLLIVKLTVCALGLLCMHVLTGQTFLLCCCLCPRGPFSSSLFSPFAFLFYCVGTLLVVDISNVDNKMVLRYISTSYLLNIYANYTLTVILNYKFVSVCGINILNSC